MIEVYCGNGKGKTTAAAGLAVRAAGNGIPVCFFQFMKDGSSGEMKLFRQLPQVSLYYPKKFYGFSSAMNGRQREEMRLQYAEFLKTAARMMEERRGALEKEIRQVIILDEVIHACNKELVSERELMGVLSECPACVELVLTGRSPSAELLEKADYISEIINRRHPFDRGIQARKGIEV